MWTTSVDDRVFIHQVVYDIIAYVASEEIDEFEVLVARYFANPTPPTPRSLRGGVSARLRSGRPCISEVAPAILVAVLSFMMLELEEASQRAPIEGLKAGLKGMIWRGAGRSGAGMWIRAATKALPEQLTMIIYCATMPIGLTITTASVREIAYRTAQIYGLSEDQCVALSHAVLDRLCRNVTES